MRVSVLNRVPAWVGSRRNSIATLIQPGSDQARRAAPSRRGGASSPSRRQAWLRPADTLIGDRLDIGGARWGLDGAEAILTLRAVISNGDFEEYWRFHLAREHQRLCPGTAQGQYTLGV